MVEIYPRLLIGRVKKGRWAERHTYLFKRFPEQPRNLLEWAVGSEDALDATVSALAMSEHEAELQTLARPVGPEYGIEGKIWRP